MSTAAVLPSTTKRIRADKLKVDEEYQRHQVPSRVKLIAANLDLDGLGVFTVSDRSNDGLYIIDGQHRHAALVSEGLGEWEVACEVFKGLTVAQEAELFRLRNNTSRPQPFDIYKAGRAAGDPKIKEIDQIVGDFGFKVTDQRADGQITAVRALEDVYTSTNGRADGTVLAEVMNLITRSWGTVFAGVEGNIIRGLGIVLETYGGKIDIDALSLKLAKFPGGPAGLIGRARILRDIRTASLARLIAAVVVSTYNRGRRSGHLAEL